MLTLFILSELLNRLSRRHFHQHSLYPWIRTRLFLFELWPGPIAFARSVFAFPNLKAIC